MPDYSVHVAYAGQASVSYRLIGSGPRRVLFFHGFPGSSIQISLFESRLIPDGLSVLCLDRPGYGKSSPAAEPQSQIQEGIRQCQAVLGQLGWTRFEVFAVSGGTPMGLSLARAMTAQVVRTTVCCGLSTLGDPKASRLIPYLSKIGMTLVSRMPVGLLSRAIRYGRGAGAQPGDRDQALLRLFFKASAPDQFVLKDGGVQNSLVQAEVEAFEQGGIGPRSDARSYLQPWGWDLGSFAGSVRFFHGLDDQVIRPAMARFMAEAIPGSELHLIEGEGHFSLPVRQMARMLTEHSNIP